MPDIYVPYGMDIGDTVAFCTRLATIQGRFDVARKVMVGEIESIQINNDRNVEELEVNVHAVVTEHSEGVKVTCVNESRSVSPDDVVESPSFIPTYRVLVEHIEKIDQKKRRFSDRVLEALDSGELGEDIEKEVQDDESNE